METVECDNSIYSPSHMATKLVEEVEIEPSSSK